jgi:pseudaminic acid cytidylyltransferase
MNICVIPARGGSKRIKKKNIKFFLGKPVIAYSILAALKSNCFDQVIVSTDDEEIKNISEKWGAKVPFIRPKDLSDDYTPINDVVIHSLESMINLGYDVKNVCCVYATAPFIQPKYIHLSYKELLKRDKFFCLSVCQFTYPVQRALKLMAGNTIEPIWDKYIPMRSQDLVHAYHDSGQFYWGTAKAFIKNKEVLSSNSTYIVLPSYLVQDIDTLDDWKRAELMFEVLQKYSKIRKI